MELLVKNSDRKEDSNVSFNQATEIAVLLLKHGANPNVRLNKKTPLYQVCRLKKKLKTSNLFFF